MPKAKKHFEFSDEIAASLSPEAKTLRVLEFIAYYLDRIDGHLEPLAAQTESGNSNGRLIAQHLGGILQLVGSIAKRA